MASVAPQRLATSFGAVRPPIVVLLASSFHHQLSSTRHCLHFSLGSKRTTCFPNTAPEWTAIATFKSVVASS